MATQKKSLSSYLKEIHEKMYREFVNSIKVQEEIEKANALQTFFQNLKDDFSKPSNLRSSINNQIISSILSQNPQLNPSLFFHHYGRKGGFTFEKEVARVIQAVTNEVAQSPVVKVQDLIIGQTTSSVQGLLEKHLLEPLTQDILKQVGTKTQKYIQDDLGQGSKQLYLAEVDGKIDVKGYDLNINITESTELTKIYELLKDATFTAKNYSSLNKYGEKILNDFIHLGKTNPYRALHSTLSYLGFDHQYVNDFLSRSFNAIKMGTKNSQEIISHLYHLQYSYELSGAGIDYKGQNLGIAKYIIYNDPKSDKIYVKSTREIISSILSPKADPPPEKYSVFKSFSFKLAKSSFVEVE